MSGAAPTAATCDDAGALTPWLQVDLLVVGSGAAGLACAVAAASRGLRVAVLDKHDQLGGTSAWSGGWMWIPGSGLPGESDPPPAPAGGAQPGDAEPPENGVPDARRYLRNELGPAFTKQCEKIDAYLKVGPQMLKFFSDLHLAPLKFESDQATPDFHQTAGHHLGGRMVRVPAFDGRRLGRLIDLLRPPLPELTVAGLAIESGVELNHFLNATRSLVSLAYVVRRLIGLVWDLLVYGRSMRLVNGNALIASLLNAATAIERDVGREMADAKAKSTTERERHWSGSKASARFERIGLFPQHPVQRLVIEDDRVVGAWVATPVGERRVAADAGVVLACGGFPHDVQRIAELFAHAPTGYEHWSAAPPENTGDGLRLGEGAGGAVRRTAAAPAAWAPVSLLCRRDGSIATYPHFIDRAKPGLIAVDQHGLRFCDEAGSYFDFVAKWITASPSDGPLYAWLVCDRCFLWRYGLGAIKPANPLPLWALRTGYLKVGFTIESLARTCGIESRGLQRTLDDYNRGVATNLEPLDPKFGRGSTPYDRSQGDGKVRPNPCVAPIRAAPFFAIRLEPGSLGTLAGLDTDARARVLNRRGSPIPGLYACGNDMSAVMGGFYPTNGVTLGSAMTFGYIAGREAAVTATKPAK